MTFTRTPSTTSMLVAPGAARAAAPTATGVATLSATLATTMAAALVVGLGTSAAVHAAAHSEVDLTTVPSGTYRSDPTHSYITFSYDHLGLSNPMLAFDDFEVEMDLDSADPSRSTISVTIDASSVVAGSEVWKGHLVGEEFFDVANNPEITFRSTSVEGAGDGAYKVDGDLTIKGEAKPVSLSVTINAAMNHPMTGDPVVGITGSGETLRSDYGLDKFAPVISDEVSLRFTAEMVKAP